MEEKKEKFSVAKFVKTTTGKVTVGAIAGAIVAALAYVFVGGLGDEEEAPETETEEPEEAEEE